MIKKIIFILGILMFYTFPICANQCDPFTINCRNANEILTKYPLSELLMAGTIKKAGQLWAIIKAPDQHVYPVTVGSLIGLGGGKIDHITSRHIIIQEEKKSVTIWLR